MAATYDPSLPTDKDWVRFLSGDRSEDNPRLQDEEIQALLQVEANKYLAAAVACELILSRSEGVVWKEVGDLKLKWSDSPASAYQLHIQKLREKGCFLLMPSPKIFKVLGRG